MRFLLVTMLAAAAGAAVPTAASGQSMDLDTARRSTAAGPAGRPAFPLVIDYARLASLDTVLPVLDDAGVVITEEQIKAAMSHSGGKALAFTLLGAGLGALVMQGVLPQPKGGADCSIYEPCTDREKVYVNVGPWAGALLGAVLMATIPDYGRDRFEAVEHIRRQRRPPAPTP